MIKSKFGQRLINIKTKVIDSHEGVTEQIETLKTIIDLELESMLCLRISPEKVKFYQDTKGFGAQVANKFPSAAFDIEEAGKCYACNRNTACVRKAPRKHHFSISRTRKSSMSFAPPPIRSAATKQRISFATETRLM